jgi:hypothetical protein
MKKTILTALTGFFILVSPVIAAETKTVCVDRKNKDGSVMMDKQNKPIQDCKEIKVHKKLEGTPVPEKGK